MFVLEYKLLLNFHTVVASAVSSDRPRHAVTVTQVLKKIIEGLTQSDPEPQPALPRGPLLVHAEAKLVPGPLGQSVPAQIAS